MTLTTRPPDAEVGWQLTVEAGVETDARQVGVPPGTQVEVRDLFFNTPARAKFLKAEATETANISEAMLRLALAHPNAHFRLRVAGRVALDLPVHRDLPERVRAALARRGASVLHEAMGDENGHRVRAFLAGPDEVSTTARSTFLFVGGRFIRDRALLHALALGYGPLLEKGRYPLAALFLQLPGADLDINVHPQKLEVRFARAQEVYAAVRHVVGAAIARAPWLRTGATTQTLRAFTRPPSYRPASDLAARAAARMANRTRRPGCSRGRPRARCRCGRATPTTRARAGLPTRFPAVRPRPGPATASRASSGRSTTSARSTAPTWSVRRPTSWSSSISTRPTSGWPTRGCGPRTPAGGIARQRLLFPIPIEVGETAAAAANSEMLGALGFEVEPHAPGVVMLRAMPEPLKDADPKPLLREVLAELAEGTPLGSGDLERVDHLLATIACHSVVRAGDVLGRPAVLALLAQLDDVDLRSHCPHGRPVMLRLSIAEIERRFGRA